MRVTATQAKNRFGSICSYAKLEPVFIEKDGKVDSVILSAKMFETLSASGNEKLDLQKRHAFEKKYRAWLIEENLRFEQEGLWCDDLKVW